MTVTATAGTGTDAETATADITFPAIGKGDIGDTGQPGAEGGYAEQDRLHGDLGLQ